MKTSLFFFNPYPGIGGADTTIMRFVRSIDLNKYNVTYFTINDIERFSNKVNFVKINSNSTFFSFFEISQIIHKDQSIKKIFFSMQYFVNVWAILFLKKINNLKIFIYEINHPIELDLSNNFIDYCKKIIIKFLVKKVYKKADLIAGNCKELSKDLSILIKTKVETLYNPSFIKIVPKNIKKKIKSSSKINILNVSRFEYQKDHLTLLKAINNSSIKKKIHLNLVGYGSNEILIKNYAKKNNIRCSIHKSNVKLSPFYKSNDLFVMSSLYEGLPTVMIEAASHCMPIVSSDFKSGSKEILGNGKFGHLFPVGNYKLLSKLIDSYYKNPHPFFAKEKKCRVNLKKFSYKKNLKKFNMILKNLSEQIN